jgi:hypothetical protein
MAEGQVTRKRRRRGRRGGAARQNDARSAADAAPEAPQPPASTPGPFEGWQWLTFPVLCAFVFGAFAMLVVVAPEDPDTGEAPVYYQVLFVVFLAAVAFCLVHIGVRFVRWWLNQRD